MSNFQPPLVLRYPFDTYIKRNTAPTTNRKRKQQQTAHSKSYFKDPVPPWCF